MARSGMSPTCARARPQLASGRAVWSVIGGLVGAGCAMLGTVGGGSGDALRDPVLSSERPSRAVETLAAQRFHEAQEALAAGDLEGARTGAEEVVERYPGAPVSGRALRLLVDVAFAQDSWREADLLAQRWIRLVPDDDPRIPALRLLQGRSRLGDSDPEGALDRLTALPAEMTPDEMAAGLKLMREAAAALDESQLSPRLVALPPEHPFGSALLAARARALYNSGSEQEAVRSARAALDAGASGTDAAVSRGVLDGRIDESLGLLGPLVVLGVLVPVTGPPSLTQVAELVVEGVRAAAAAMDFPGRLQIVVEDDRASPEGATEGMRALEEAGAVAVIGPLDEPELVAAALARTRPVPMVSPTAPEVALGAENVYTLGGADIEGARALARWAASAGLLRVALVHPRSRETEDEAAAFEEVFGAAGGMVLGRFLYDRGTTYFEPQMQSVRALRPDAVVLPIPAADVEILAPQVTFFGLDTLDIRVLGTAGWTREEVLAAVSPRHTNGVVAVTADAVREPESVGTSTLVSVYEDLFQRTLRSPVPAVGYDVAALVLEALRGGARSPAGVSQALERIEGYPGATGELGVVGGRVTRRHEVVCIRDRQLLPIPSGEHPFLVDRRPPPNSAGVRPTFALEGPPVQVICPGTPLPPDARVIAEPQR